MISADTILNAQEKIIRDWGERGKRVIEVTARVTPFNDNADAFLKYCVCCGGDWGQMLLTGIKELWPEVWDAIPDDMGHGAFYRICDTLTLCGVDTSK